MGVRTTDPEEIDAAELLGSPVKRREDPALLTGDAEYTDDVRDDRLVHLAVRRSQAPHARIEAVDTADAAAMDGVVGVYTAGDLADAGTLPTDEPEFGVAPDHPILAGGKVRHQGDAIAAVVAEDRYVAHEAAGAIDVDYERLDPLTDPRRATEEGAPTLHEEAPDNVAFDWELGDADATDAAFERADRVVALELENNRVAPTAMEPRAAVARFRPSTGELTVTMTAQNPHDARDHLAAALDHPAGKIRVRAPDVGGGFGAKLQPYSGYTLAAWCAMRTGRPVKWQATRTEEFAAMVHGRDHRSSVELAVDDDGTMRALRVATTANVGGYLTTGGAGVPTRAYGRMIAGQYDLEAVHLRVRGVFTTTAPVAAYRGAGRPEACYQIERAVRRAARELGEDPVELRRRNFVESFPHDAPTGHVYDSGDYAKTLDAALEAVDYPDLRERRRDDGRYLGVGVSCYVEACGAAPGMWESGQVRFKPSGEVVVGAGTHSHGQGHETSFAQVVADRLGVDYGDVEVVEGDTGRVPEGQGTAGSRSAPVGGSAVVRSAEKVLEKARRIAAHRLEASPEDVAFEEGAFHVRGAPDRSIRIEEVARTAYSAGDLPEDVEPGLEATSFYDPPNYTFPFGTHVAVVAVAPDTGEVSIERYVAVDDVGEQINPKIVEGQIHGGVAQGIGQALYEGAEYDESGNLLAGSLQDYAMPKAFHVPELETDSTVTPCPHNPLGVKGVGEAGAIAAPPAVANAVLDALEPLGVADLDMPLTDESVWRAIREADGG